MTSSHFLFSTYTPCAGNKNIKVADGSFSAIAEKGPVKISSFLVLHDVLHVPNLACNLILVSKLSQSSNCHVIFDSSMCKFQDMVSRRMIGNAKEFGGIYFLENDHLSQPTTTLCLNSVSDFDKVMIWHYRLGHSNFYYLRYLLPNLFKNKSPSYHCEFCELAKHHRSFFPPQNYKASKPFSLIHSDVCGPSRVSTFKRTLVCHFY
ncbi:hypothetical protein CXB51_031651 [Gossypium anomalum]|uniref:GAG-pre-integrase domain-containing protein n=1 Tax=Gossypium anomalum TaxID=47600 RepID=A0A8J6CH74_9ROSI|nr:hypothetical protein CXB51_031651 [Gossypium anomalum]